MDLAETFEEFAAWAAGSSPLYRRLATGIAGDPDLLALAADVPEGRTPPNVLLAAVHYLLLAGREHPLGAFYPSVTDDPRDPTTTDPLPAFREFCRTHAEDLRPLLSTRRTQTNSVRRYAGLLPAFAFLDRQMDDPPSLVEVGTSAGLNLLWDRYGYDYGEAGRYDDPGASAVVESTVRAGDPPLADPPAVRRRVGVAREDPPPVRAGDALEVLPAVLADLPDPVVVSHTLTLYQFDPDERRRVRELLSEVAADRDRYWLAGERSVDSEDRELWLEWTTDPGGELARLGAFEQHGRWIRWVDG